MAHFDLFCCNYYSLMTFAEPMPPWLTELHTACAPVLYLCYADRTDGHAIAGALDGRAVRADGRDIQLLVVSSVFEGCSPLERQHKVNEVLSPHIVQGILHSVQVRCYTLSQWEKLGRPKDIGSPCSILLQSDPNVKDVAGDSLSLQACTAEGVVGEAAAESLAESADEAADEAAAAETTPSDRDPQPPIPVTVEMIVEHMKEQGEERSVSTARAILSCECASDTAKCAAQIIIDRLVSSRSRA